MVGSNEGTCQILEIICELVQEYVRVPDESEASGSQGEQVRKDVALSMLGLLHAIGWTAPDKQALK